MDELLVEVATNIADYRTGDMATPDAEHVGKWVSQFDVDYREPLLRELAHVWKQLYISKNIASSFLKKIIENGYLATGNQKSFWRGVNFLNIQQKGHSQADMLMLFDGQLKKKHGLSINACGGSEVFLYLDDVLFTGNRITTDLKQWLTDDAPAAATVNVVLVAEHALGAWQVGNNLKDAAKAAGKQIKFPIWRVETLENRKAYKDKSDVLWPTTLVAGAEQFEVGSRAHVPRTPGGSSQVFSSEAGRQVLEQSFLKAGLKIRSFSENPSSSLRPLGFGAFGVGFGSLVASFRNCPNNAPLAIWWGDPAAPPGHPFRKWRPLLPRKTYGHDGGF